MAIAVVIVPSGGLPISEGPTGFGTPMVEATNGIGLAVTFVEGSGGGGMSVSGISSVLPGAPVISVVPAITGTNTIGSVLTTTNGTWTNTPLSYARQWRRNGINIAGATALTYTLVAADNAAAMTCRVVATNAIGPSAGSVSNTITVVDITPVNSVAPAITGTAAVGSVLTVTNGTWSNSPSFTRQWRRGGVAIGSATATTYTLVAADNLAVIDCVVTATNAVAVVTANSNSVTVAEARPVNSVAPVVTGTATVGQTLSCTTGTWSNTPNSYAYQWTRAGVDISGATSSTYLLVTADAATSVLCRVTASNAIGAAPTPVNSNAMTIGAAGTTTVTAPNGQWWKFTGSVTNGVYVNGDPWVLDPGGGVSLIEVSYMPTGTGQEARNGGMVNPTFNTMVESATASPLDVTTALRQGYDGRIDESAIRTNWIYDASYNAHATLPKTLVAGDSLVSVRSQNFPPPATEGPCTQTFAEFWAVGGTNKVALSRMAVVTVVGSAPFADSFRPNYYGTTKINKRFSDCNLALLPNLAAPYNPKGTAQESFHLDTGSIYGAGGTDGNRTQAEMIHINSLRDVWYWIYPAATSNRSMVQAHYNQQWHTPVGTTLGQLAMYCMCDFSDRDTFLKRLLQVAIDAYAIASSTTLYMVPFCSGAGYYPSPCWLIRLAGLLFNDTGMKNAKDISTNHVDYAGVAIKKWGEMNRVYLTPNATAHAQYLRVPGEDYTAGFPLYGDRPTADRSAGQSSNGTEKDPAGVYDMNDYRYGTPHPTYPIGYLNWAPLSGPNVGVEQTGTPYNTGDPPPFNAEPWLGAYRGGALGTYMSNANRAMMATVLSSIAMGDEAFWGGAVVPFAIRTANDVKMIEGYGYEFTDAGLGAYIKDVRQMGGTGNGWMTDMWDLIVGEPAAPGGEFERVAFGAGDYMVRGAGMTGVSDGEQFTFVIRCKPTDTGTLRWWLIDPATNIGIRHAGSDLIQLNMWGAAERINTVSTSGFTAADGVQTIYISGRTTAGSNAFHMYKGSTNIGSGSGAVASSGTMDFTASGWSCFAYNDGSGQWTGEVEFVWFDTVYYDVSNATIRDKWLPENIGANGSGPGAQPKLYLTGNAAAWNSDTLNLGTGGIFTMTGTVTDV